MVSVSNCKSTWNGASFLLEMVGKCGRNGRRAAAQDVPAAIKHAQRSTFLRFEIQFRPADGRVPTCVTDVGRILSAEPLSWDGHVLQMVVPSTPRPSSASDGILFPGLIFLSLQNSLRSESSNDNIGIICAPVSLSLRGTSTSSHRQRGMTSTVACPDWAGSNWRACPSSCNHWSRFKIGTDRQLTSSRELTSFHLEGRPTTDQPQDKSPNLSKGRIQPRDDKRNNDEDHSPRRRHGRRPRRFGQPRLRRRLRR